MSRRLLVALAAAAATLTLAIASVTAASPKNFVTPLAGGEEVPANDSLGRGAAIFQLSPDGSEISYRLIASNIENILQSHIHIGQFGVNGPVVVFLYPDNPPAQLIPGRHDGVLMTGSFTAADFLGPLAGEPMSVLVDALESGNAYVNIHTTQHPGGEIRGQVD